MDSCLSSNIVCAMYLEYPCNNATVIHTSILCSLAGILSLYHRGNSMLPHTEVMSCCMLPYKSYNICAGFVHFARQIP